MDSFCVDGICYYTSCEDENCEVHYCKYYLLTGEKKCTTNKSLGLFKLALQTNNLRPIITKNKTSNNTEDNYLELIKKIIN